MSKSKQQTGWTSSDVAKLEKYAKSLDWEYLLYDLFPPVVIGPLSVIEFSKFKGVTKDTLDYFRILINTFCWQLLIVNNTIETQKIAVDKLPLEAVYTVYGCAICIDKFYDSLLKYTDNDKILETIAYRTSRHNAGIIFGPFVGLSPFVLASNFVRTLYETKIKVATEHIFGNGAILRNIDPDYVRLKKWLYEIREGILSILPPIEEWPIWKYKSDAESFICKLVLEICEIQESFDVNKKSYSNYLRAEKFIKGEWPKPMANIDIMGKLKSKGFSFSEGQAYYNGKDLELPCGKPIEILRKLDNSLGIVVKHKDLDLSSSNSNSSESLRNNISIIRKALKSKEIPFIITSNRGVGFTLKQSR
jgi:hypothetical protein